jgi:excisionase family DNA binding protein
VKLSVDEQESNVDATCCGKLLGDCHASSPVSDEKSRALICEDLQLFSVVEVAQYLGIGRSKVYELLYKGELKSVKIGGSRRVRYSDLGEYVRYLDDAS